MFRFVGVNPEQKAALILQIRKILSQNPGIKLIEKTSGEDISSVLINNIINLLIDADTSDRATYLEILSFFSSIQNNMDERPYQSFVAELTAIMFSINADKEKVCDTITSDLLDPESALSRYEDGTPEVIVLDVSTSVDSAATATGPADEPVALVLEPSKTSDKYYDDVVKATREYLGKINQYEQFVKELTSAPTTLQENFQGFIDALPLRAVFEQSLQAFMENLSDNPEPRVKNFIRALEKPENAKRLKYMPYFNIPSIFGQFFSLADDAMIKQMYDIADEGDTTTIKVRIIKLLGEILLKRAALGEELRQLETTLIESTNIEYTRLRLSKTKEQFEALAELELTLQTEITVLSLPESHVIPELKDGTRPPLPAEIDELISTLGVEPSERTTEETPKSPEQIKASILEGLYPFVEDHTKIPDEQKVTEAKLDTIFSEPNPAIHALISCYKETSMARFSNSLAVYWGELIKCMDVISTLDAPIKLPDGKHYFFWDKRTHNKSHLPPRMWRVAFFISTFSEGIRNNKFLIMYLIAFNSYYLLGAPEQLRNDLNIVKFAVHKKADRRGRSGQSISLAGDELRHGTHYPEIAQLALEDTTLAEYFIECELSHPTLIKNYFEHLKNYPAYIPSLEITPEQHQENKHNVAIYLLSQIAVYVKYLRRQCEKESFSADEKQKFKQAYDALVEQLHLNQWPRDLERSFTKDQLKSFMQGKEYLKTEHQKYQATVGAEPYILAALTTMQEEIRLNNLRSASETATSLYQLITICVQHLDKQYKRASSDEERLRVIEAHNAIFTIMSKNFPRNSELERLCIQKEDFKTAQQKLKDVREQFKLTTSPKSPAITESIAAPTSAPPASNVSSSATAVEPVSGLHLEENYSDIEERINIHFHTMGELISNGENAVALETAISLLQLMTGYAEHLYKQHERTSSHQEKEQIIKAYHAMNKTLKENWPSTLAQSLKTHEGLNREFTALQAVNTRWNTGVFAQTKSSKATTPQDLPVDPEHRSGLSPEAVSALQRALAAPSAVEPVGSYFHPHSSAKKPAFWGGLSAEPEPQQSALSAPTTDDETSSQRNSVSSIDSTGSVGSASGRKGFFRREVLSGPTLITLEGINNFISHYEKAAAKWTTKPDAKIRAQKKVTVGKKLQEAIVNGNTDPNFLKVVFESALKWENTQVTREPLTIQSFFSPDTKGFIDPTAWLGVAPEDHSVGSILKSFGRK